MSAGFATLQLVRGVEGYLSRGGRRLLHQHHGDGEREGKEGREREREVMKSRSVRKRGYGTKQTPPAADERRL